MKRRKKAQDQAPPEVPASQSISGQDKGSPSESDRSISQLLGPGPGLPPKWTPPTPGLRRRPLIPGWVLLAVLGVFVLIALIVGIVIWTQQASLVRVPSVIGSDRTAASTRLQELGLRMRVGDRRFSASAPLNTIVDQSPVAGTKVGEGTVIVVALSAGSESFAMPDVIGQPLDKARRQLRDRGLTVDVQSQPSDKPANTVLSTFPSPGVTVSTGDTVRLTVASGGGATDVLLPTNLTGSSFVIDPAPMPPGVGTDTTMDIARRIRALLEASGARVVVTREVTDSGEAVSTLARARKAREASGTALIGFVVTQSGESGFGVFTVPATGTTQPYYLKSAALGTAAVDALKQVTPAVSSSPAQNDPIVTGTGIPGIRIRLGSWADPEDQLQFADPQWADDTARAVYRAVASVYGTK